MCQTVSPQELNNTFMPDRLKKILLIAGFVLVAIGMVVAVYFIFFRGAQKIAVNRNGNVNGLPSVNNGNISTTGNVNTTNLPTTETNTTNTNPSHQANGGSTLVDTIVSGNAGSIASSGNGLQYYDQTTGSFYLISPDGTSRTLMTDAKYPSVQDISWSQDGKQAVLTFPDNSKVAYNFTTKKQTTLASELNNFSFSPSGNNLVSKYLDANDKSNQWLIVSKNDGTTPQSVEQLGENAGNVIPAWSPNNQVVATYESSVNGNQSQIIFLGQNGENFPSVNIEGRGYIPVWSPDGSKILYSTYSAATNDNPHLYIMNGSVDGLGQNIIDLGLDTRADKCTFSQNGYTIYCAVPYYMNAGSGPQPDLSAGIPDNIYEINLLKGSSTLLARPVDSNGTQRFSIGALRLAPDESSLFFIDQQTGAVERVQLR